MVRLPQPCSKCGAPVHNYSGACVRCGYNMPNMPTLEARMSRTQIVYLSVDRDGLTGDIQLSINDENGGYRISGPKYCGESVTLKSHVLNERDVTEIAAYVRKAKRLLKRAKPRGESV